MENPHPVLGSAALILTFIQPLIAMIRWFSLTCSYIHHELEVFHQIISMGKMLYTWFQKGPYFRDRVPSILTFWVTLFLGVSIFIFNQINCWSLFGYRGSLLPISFKFWTIFLSSQFLISCKLNQTIVTPPGDPSSHPIPNPVHVLNHTSVVLSFTCYSLPDYSKNENIPRSIIFEER